MRTRFIMLTLLLAASAADPATGGGGAVWPADPGLQDYLDWSAHHHPAVSGERHRVDALRGDADRAGALPDLRLAWGEMIVPVETRVGPQQRILSVSQAFPWFGTLGARESAAGALADAAAAGVRVRQLAVAREVRAAWYRLAALSAESELVAASLDLARDSARWLRTRYAADEAAYGAVLAAEMAVGRLETEAVALRDRRRPLTVGLNAAAGLGPDTPPPAAELPGRDPAAVHLPDAARLRELQAAHNPELAALARRRDSSRHAVEAAGGTGKPTFSLGLDYIMTGDAVMPDVVDSGKDPVIARLALQLPLWGGRSGAETRAATGRLLAAGEDLGDARQRLGVALEEALYVWRDTGRRLRLFEETLLPRAEQAVAVTLAAYEAGSADFGAVLEARQGLLALETETVRLRRDRLLSLNDVAHLVGLPPEALAAASGPRKDEP